MPSTRKFDPWATAPAWAFELQKLLVLILGKTETIMSEVTEALDELEQTTQAVDGAADSAEAAFLRLADLIESLRNDSTDPATAARIRAASAELRQRAAQLGVAVEATPQA